jgi:hypothetical protein
MTTHYGRDALEILTSNCEAYQFIQEGEQVKFNHLDCSAGEDTKTRLYVKNVDGAFLFHCHNCGESGYYRPKENYSPIAEKVEHRPVLIPRSAPTYESLTKITDYDMFRIEGQLWLGQYGFDEELTDAFGIAETHGGLVLPIYGQDLVGKNIVGCQIRKYNGTPKYTTYSTQEYSYLRFGTIADPTKPLVITEDLLSSYKLHAAGYHTLCLLGTKMDRKILEWVARQHNRQVLWLDDDMAGHKASIKLLREFSPMLPDLTAIFNHQPKEIDMETLKTMEI